MTSPMMSLAVVMKGPVAKAGSMLRLSSIKGTNAPKSAAKTITHNKEALTVVLRVHPNPSTMLVSRMTAEQINPLTRPTLNSLSRRPTRLPMFTLAEANPCTTMAEDCTPTLPPIAAMSGMKRAISGLFSMSKAPMT